MKSKPDNSAVGQRFDVMKEAMDSLSEPDVEALLNYYASQQ